MLNFVDYCQKPDSIIEAFRKDVTIREVRETLIVAFRKMKIYLMVTESALNVCEKGKKDVLDDFISFQQRGFYDIENECDHCKQSLL